MKLRHFLWIFPIRERRWKFLRLSEEREINYEHWKERNIRLRQITLEKSTSCVWNAQGNGKFPIHDEVFLSFLRREQWSATWLDSQHTSLLWFHFSALSSNGGVLSICIDNLTVKEAIHNINYVRALAGLDHVGLGPVSSPKKYALLLAELARDRLWNNASLKKLVGGNIVRILREVN